MSFVQFKQIILVYISPNQLTLWTEKQDKHNEIASNILDTGQVNKRLQRISQLNVIWYMVKHLARHLWKNQCYCGRQRKVSGYRVIKICAYLKSIGVYVMMNILLKWNTTGSVIHIYIYDRIGSPQMITPVHDNHNAADQWTYSEILIQSSS